MISLITYMLFRLLTTAMKGINGNFYACIGFAYFLWVEARACIHMSLQEKYIPNKRLNKNKHFVKFATAHFQHPKAF